MANSAESDSDKKGQYRIGAVCRLTGLSAHVLRVWEKRYSVITPSRESNQRRLYSEADIEKLRLLKSLVDRGQAIGSLVTFSSGELRERLRQSGGSIATPANRDKARIAVVGEVLRAHANSWPESDFYEIVGAYGNVVELESKASGIDYDMVLAETPGLHLNGGIEANYLATRLDTRNLVMVYNFASDAAIERVSCQARAHLEVAMQKVIEFEGIDLDRVR